MSVSENWRDWRIGAALTTTGKAEQTRVRAEVKRMAAAVDLFRQEPKEGERRWGAGCCFDG